MLRRQAPAFSDAFSFSSKDAADAEAIEKEVEIEQAGVAFPGRHKLARFCVVGARAKTKMLLQIVPAADVITGKNVEAAHAAQERVFGGPSADAANGEQFFESRVVVELVERFEMQVAGSDRAAELKDGAFLIVAVAEGAKRAGSDVCKISGRGARMCGGTGGSGVSEVFNEAIQEHHADVQRNLLARNGIEKSFEDGGIARRLEADERGGERAQSFLFRGEGVERAEVDREAEHSFESGAKDRFERRRAIRARCRNAEARTRGRADLLDGEFDDLIACVRVEKKRAAIRLAVPAVKNVFWAAAQRPDG